MSPHASRTGGQRTRASGRTRQARSTSSPVRSGCTTPSAGGSASSQSWELRIPCRRARAPCGQRLPRARSGAVNRLRTHWARGAASELSSTSDGRPSAISRSRPDRVRSLCKEPAAARLKRRHRHPVLASYRRSSSTIARTSCPRSRAMSSRIARTSSTIESAPTLTLQLSARGPGRTLLRPPLQS